MATTRSRGMADADTTERDAAGGCVAGGAAVVGC
jgi:hypothetical protein